MKALLVPALLALAPGAAAQVCPAPILYLLVRSDDGAVLSAETDLTVTPTLADNDGARPPLLDVEPVPAGFRGGLAPMLQEHRLFSATGRGCRLDVDELRVTYGGETMTLRLPIRLNTRARHDHSGALVLEAPFRPGAWAAAPVCGYAPAARSPLRVLAGEWVAAASPAATFAPCPAPD